MDYAIVPLTWRDLRRVYRLEQEIFPKDAYPYLDLAFLLLTPGMVNLKAQSADGEFRGFIAVGDSWLPGRPAWIITIGVARAQQNRGIGRALLLAIEDRLRARRVRLTVRKSNAPAIHLYTALGYHMLMTHPRYYNDGEDGVVMEKTR